MFLRRLTAWLLLLSLGAGAAPALAEVPEPFLNSDLRRLVYTPDGAGPFQYYAQNDPIWERTLYEARNSEYLRPFGDGGCNPTALAMVLATLLPPERLKEIDNFSNPRRDFWMCEHSLNEYHCGVHATNHAQSKLSSPEEYYLVLPLVLGSYAAGNTPDARDYRVPPANGGGTSSLMIDVIAEAYGMGYGKTRDLSEVMEAIDTGGLAIALCAGTNQPFSGTLGHYVVVASYDEEYIYVLDPFVREKYAKDKRKVIEHVDTGIKKIKIENVPHLLINFYMLFWAPEDVEDRSHLQAWK